MTIVSKTTFIACAVLSTFAFASTAHAGNAFNKFPANQSATNTHGYQVTGFSKSSNRGANAVTRRQSVKRVVQPVPGKPSTRLSYTSHVGTLNQKGFNKMNPKKKIVVKAMPVFIDKRAYTAR